MLGLENLHAYQHRAGDHIRHNAFCALFMDMGLGKTVSTLTVLEELQFYLNGTLVIAPKQVTESVWKQETQKWEHLQDMSVVRVIGSPAQRRHALREKADIHIVSRDNIVWLINEFGSAELPWECLVVDELSSFKSHKSKRFKALKMVLNSFERVIGLTATPAANSLEDLWSQVFLLDRGERLGKNITAYRREYFRNVGRGFDKFKAVRGADERVFGRIKDICLSMRAEDYLDMPERIENVVHVDLPKKLAEQYKVFKRDLYIDLIESGEELTVASAAALSNKLLQYCNGAVYDAERNVIPLHDLKIERCAELIEAAQGRPVIIAYTYKHDLSRLLKRFEKQGIRKLKTSEDIDDWNAGKIPILIMHPASGGHGINLQKGGNQLIFFGQTWSLELLQQIIGRIYRQGQTSFQVIIHHLIARIAGIKSQDEAVRDALEHKNGGQEALLSAVKADLDYYRKLTRR